MGQLTRFSANLGFLWTELSLPDAIKAAGYAGFAAVECHWPYDVPPDVVKAALLETGLPIICINTRRDSRANGGYGLAAVPGREADARSAIDEAMNYASAIGATDVHVMAGNASGSESLDAYLSNLRWATERAKALGLMILIEPLNRHDAPDYFLRSTDQARDIIQAVGHPSLRLMFDCYHVGRTEGDLITRLTDLLPYIGHIQFASVPDRGAPDHGEIEYRTIFATLKKLGWDRPLGAEYRPTGSTDSSLGWMRLFS